MVLLLSFSHCILTSLSLSPHDGWCDLSEEGDAACASPILGLLSSLSLPAGLFGIKEQTFFKTKFGKVTCHFSFEMYLGRVIA